MYWRRLADLPGWLKALLVGQLINSAGALAWVYLTLYLVEDRGLSAQQAGFAAAGYGIGLVAGNLGGGWFGDRFGLRRAALGSQLGWAVACLVMPFMPTAGLAATAVVAGLLGGAGRPNLSALVATALPAERRREGIALSRSAVNAGFVIGPPLGGLLVTVDFGLVFVVDTISSLALAVVIWRWVPAVRRGPGLAVRGGVVRALLADRSVIVVLLTIIVVDTAYKQLFATVPLLVRDLGAPAVAYGILVGMSCVVIVVAEAPMAVRLRRRRANVVIGAGFGLVGLAMLTLGVWKALAGIAVAVAILSAGEVLYKSTATAYVIDAAPEGMVGRFSSLYAAASISGVFLAPALGGTAYEHAPDLLYPAAGVLALLAAITVAFTNRPREPRP